MAPLSGERLKVLMTADCVGGVWRYAVDLCTAAKPHGVEPVIAGLGPRPQAAQEREAFRAGIRLVWLDAELDWVAAGSPALEQAARLLNRVIDDVRPDVLHLNTPALAHLATEIPCVATLHSCVASWWAAVRGTPLPAEWEWNRQNVERGSSFRPRRSPRRSARSMARFRVSASSTMAARRLMRRRLRHPRSRW